MPERKEVVLLHPVRETRHGVKNEVKIIRRHVPRHIELTAVSMQIETNKIRVIESKDSKRTTRSEVKYKKEIISRKIYDEEFDPGSG